jgi:AcrR family transcriptional regulator
VPKVSQEHLDARRAQILDGARRAFSRWGYEGTTVARLEEETGLSRGAIFHYFKGKRDLFVQLALDVDRSYRQLIMAEGFDAAIRAMANESAEWIGVVLETHAQLRHDPELEKLMTPSPEDQMRLIEWFRDRQEDGTFRADVEVMELGRFATMVLNGLALRVVAGDETDPEATIRLLNDALAPRE